MQALKQRAKTAAPDPYGQGDERTQAAKLADALTGFLDERCRYDITVDVVISADALIGDNDWTPEHKRLGPMASEVARRLAWSPDARWQRLVTDPCTGALVDMHSHTYRIPKKIREAVKARDRFCRFPGCHAPVEYFDIDHITPWPAGQTTPDELAGECRRHHVVKHKSGWNVKRVRRGCAIDLHWTSPLGQTHTTTPHRYGTD